MKNRCSYKGLMSNPAYGLYRDGKLIASCRAATRQDAIYVFRVHGLSERGDKVKKVESR